ncbi:MAG: hypothetical protein RBR19_14420 [Sedimentisphaerales bacterium]|jgi:hypothetical protein|nr:hypothetical protein [Sedimentisphaerales bacterium]
MSKMSKTPEPATAAKTVHAEIEELIADATDLGRQIDALGSSIEAGQRAVAAHLAQADEHLSQYQSLLLGGDPDGAARELDASKADRVKAKAAAEEAAGHREALGRLATAAQKMWARFVALSPRVEEHFQQARCDHRKISLHMDGISGLATKCREVARRMDDLAGPVEPSESPAAKEPSYAR